MTTTRTTKRNIHADLMRLAERLIKKHVEKDPEYGSDEKCFNLFTYLDDLENQVEELLGNRTLIGDFKLHGHAIARYLWVCLCIGEGSSPYPNKFRSMPVLD